MATYCWTLEDFAKQCWAKRTLIAGPYSVVTLALVQAEPPSLWAFPIV